MKRTILQQLVLLMLFYMPSTSLSAQVKSDKVKNEITEALKLWNTATKNANTEELITLFDNSDNILVIGSDSGEIYKGKDHIKEWLNAIFKHNSFSWEMDRTDIDYNGNTAWVFIDGSMIVTNDKGNVRKTPYRFTGIMIKRNKEWKWRLFDGSIPKGE
ncbi:MAG: nuclear transport factor 2 family protein [Bacteroidales bacterium]